MKEYWVGLPWSPRIKSDKAEAIVTPNAFLAQLSKKSGHPRPAAASTKCRYQMHRVFQNFIDLLSSAKDPASFSEAISVTAAALDLSCFGYLAPPRKQTKPRSIST